MTMAAGDLLSSLTSGHSKLMTEWKKKDVRAAGKSLDTMKLLLTEVAFLPITGNPKECQKVGSLSLHIKQN